jgi:hypothetical protein
MKIKLFKSNNFMNILNNMIINSENCLDYLKHIKIQVIFLYSINYFIYLFFNAKNEKIIIIFLNTILIFLSLILANNLLLDNITSSSFMSLSIYLFTTILFFVQLLIEIIYENINLISIIFFLYNILLSISILFYRKKKLDNNIKPINFDIELITIEKSKNITENCSICLQNDQNDPNNQNDQNDQNNQNNLIKTKCNHIFHKNCIEQWLNLKQICPNCRNSINIL